MTETHSPERFALMPIEEFAAYIEKLPYGSAPDVGFDMGNAAPMPSHLNGHECGTACCIGGHARLLLGRIEREPYNGTISRALARLLGIDIQKAHAVCYPYRNARFPESRDKLITAFLATPVQAAKVLRHLDATGVVDWDVAMQKEPT